jgi:hypothetical protein
MPQIVTCCELLADRELPMQPWGRRRPQWVLPARPPNFYGSAEDLIQDSRDAKIVASGGSGELNGAVEEVRVVHSGYFPSLQLIRQVCAYTREGVSRLRENTFTPMAQRDHGDRHADAHIRLRTVAGGCRRSLRPI